MKEIVKGYSVPDGYMGLVKGKYQLFASESVMWFTLHRLNMTRTEM